MLSQEDVNFIENSLSYEEKVSLLFLLYGERNPKYAHQIVAVASQAPASEQTNYLVDWMNHVQQSSQDWEDELLEALTIMEQNLLLLRVGYDDEELRLRYFPRTSEIAFFVHPMLKGLYHFCERLDDEIASKLANQLFQSVGISSQQNQCMETVMLQLLCNKSIQLGSKQSGQECNLLLLNAACKAIEMYDESDFLKSIVSHFNRHICKRDQEQSDASAKNIPNTGDVVSKHRPAGTVVTTVESHHSPLESYTFHPERAGIVLLINQFSFYRETNPELLELVPVRPLKDRKGTEVDKNALESLFNDFGYDLILEENITHHQILQAVQHAVQRIKPIHCSLIVCLLSHGQEGKVFGSNSIPVEVKAIQQLMANERLTGKPKLLIVQACQGADLQSAVPIPNLEHDGLDGGEKTASVFMDFLVAWSTVPGFASIRHIEKGSWFIQELCTKLRQLYGSEHIMDILTAVINDVASKRGYGNECMVPVVQSTLSKKLYFHRRS